MTEKRWTHAELVQELERYRELIEATDLSPTTKQTYSYHPGNFVAWLDERRLPNQRAAQWRHRGS
jgi:hypothetical protein